MTANFLHGVETVEVEKGPRPVRVVKSAVIGLIGTALAGAVNTPAVITGLSWLFIAVPAVLLFLTAWVVRRYPLTEAAHLEVRTELTRRGR